MMFETCIVYPNLSSKNLQVDLEYRGATSNET